MLLQLWSKVSPCTSIPDGSTLPTPAHIDPDVRQPDGISQLLIQWPWPASVPISMVFSRARALVPKSETEGGRTRQTTWVPVLPCLFKTCQVTPSRSGSCWCISWSQGSLPSLTTWHHKWKQRIWSQDDLGLESRLHYTQISLKRHLPHLQNGY